MSFYTIAFPRKIPFCTPIHFFQASGFHRAGAKPYAYLNKPSGSDAFGKRVGIVAGLKKVLAAATGGVD
jgi:hypothetical protein